MEFELIEGSGQFEIEFTGEILDVYSMGVINLNMQDIIDKVSFWMLSQEGLLEPTWRRPHYLPRRRPPAYKRIVKGDIRYLGLGSLSQAFTFALNVVMSDPHVIAILQNLGANIIWAIGASGVRGIRRRRAPRIREVPPLRRNDPFDVGANLRDMAMALAENTRGRSEIIFKYTAPDEETMEVTVSINGGGN